MKIFKRFIKIKQQVCGACLGVSSKHQCIDHFDDIQHYYNAIIYCYINLEISIREYQLELMRWRRLKSKFLKNN